jgi:hypothetical protein
MDYYEIWANLNGSTGDLAFCRAVNRYLGYLKAEGLIEGFRLTRRKLGFGPPDLGEFHISLEVRDLAQLEAAFGRVAIRGGEVEALHRAVYSAVTDVRFALYRDFPDAQRAEEDSG